MKSPSRIYTRTGDHGWTRLGDQSLVRKYDPRVEAFGTVDELNAVLGLAVAAGIRDVDSRRVRVVQHELFDLGAELSMPAESRADDERALRLTHAQVERLECEIDELSAQLPPLKSFVLPGGRSAAAWLHLARTVCRRAERLTWSLAEAAKVNEQVMIYLNRLSDWLFVMARMANGRGEEDLAWQPGRTRESGHA